MKIQTVAVAVMCVVAGCPSVPLGTEATACGDGVPRAQVWALPTGSELAVGTQLLQALGAEVRRELPRLGVIAYVGTTATSTIAQHELGGWVGDDLPTLLPGEPALMSAMVPRFAINDVVPVGWQRMGVREAWLGLGGGRGYNVRVAVVDSGVDATQPDLLDTVVAQENFTSACGGVSDCTDAHGSGTHAAGIIAAAENDLGTLGVVPDARLLVAQVVQADGAGSLSALLAGLDWALAQDADVALLSPLVLGTSVPACKALARASQAGLPLLVPSGEVPALSASPTPNGLAACEAPIVVGFVGEDDWPLPVSPADGRIDVVAPGVSVVGPAPNAAWTLRTGSGAAAAYATGVAALLLGRYPFLTPEGLRDVLERSATDAGEPGPDAFTGRGVLFPAAALRAALYGWNM